MIVTSNGARRWPHSMPMWFTVRDGELWVWTYAKSQKVRNLERDPRVALSVEAPGRNAMGMQEYLVLQGTATVQLGGGPELLQELAHVYLGPDVKFPPMDDPPPGSVVRITVENITGVGPWHD